MTATNGRAMKARGSAFERLVVAYLREHNFPRAERAYGAGRPDDVGDVDGIPWLACEIKAHRSIDLAGFVDEAVSEAENAGAGVVGLVVAKRRGKPVSESYAVMRLSDWCELASEKETT